MPCIYARFMEKEARQWRQIYKVREDIIFLHISFSTRDTGAPTAGILDQTWLGTRRGRRSLTHIDYQDAEKLPLHR